MVLQAGADAAAVAREHRDRHGAAVQHVYSRALAGYAARIPAARLDEVRADRLVAYVEADAEVRARATQSNATWGIDRIDQRALPLSGTYSYSRAGSGVRAYFVDSGIRASHQEFDGRVSADVHRRRHPHRELTLTDDKGATATTSQTVTVKASSNSAISLPKTSRSRAAAPTRTKVCEAGTATCSNSATVVF